MASFTCARAVRLLSPVQHQQLLEPLQEFPRDLLDLVAFLRTQLGRRTRQDVEDHQLFFGQMFPHMALLLVVQGAAEGEQFVEQVLDVPAAGVVGLDQLFKLRQEVGARLVEREPASPAAPGSPP